MKSLPGEPIKSTRSAAASSCVYLIGAGPGDPELLTLRAARLLGSADVIVYDHLVSDGVMAYAAPSAERIYVGKQTNCHTLKQEQINALLVKLAQQGKKVVRLKGGDPFIFGRGGEEVEELAEHGVRFEIVPGITAASGISSYAGIPLTHRDYAQSCVFTTGHLKDGSINLNWQTLVQPHQTVVIYMGLGALPEICRQLIKHGAPSDFPVALVQQGTTIHQRVLTGTLSTIANLSTAMQFQSPSLIIVGEVVKLSQRLQWFHPATQHEACLQTA